MKKSEYEAKSRRFWMDSVTPPMEAAWIPGWLEKYVANDVRAAEAAGVVWEPEEEPLPKRVTVRTYPGGVVGDLWEAGGGPMSTEARTRMLDEAARRYNAWPELEKLAEEPTGGGLVPGTPTGRWFTVGEPNWRTRLRAILRGGAS